MTVRGLISGVIVYTSVASVVSKPHIIIECFQDQPVIVASDDSQVQAII